ncbi:l-ascorbate oxidase-like protein [Hordeum vulgare]|nr:l-ascorbate oxidase-like protein [Hordeum vulgare]
MVAEQTAAELNSLKIERGGHKARVAKVQHELQDANAKSEALEQKFEEQATELSTLSFELKSERVERRFFEEKVHQSKKSMDGKPYLLQSDIGGNMIALLTRLWRSPGAFRDLPCSAAHAAMHYAVCDGDTEQRVFREPNCRGKTNTYGKLEESLDRLAGRGRHSDGTALAFVVELHDVPRGHFHLPRPFPRVMEAAKPLVLWLRASGCSHGAMEMHVEYPKRRSTLLGRGWKAFARAHSLEDGHILRFKLVEDNMLFVKFYGRSGVRRGCCEESSRGAEFPSLSDSEEEDSGGSGTLGRSGSLGVKSEYDSPSSD